MACEFEGRGRGGVDFDPGTGTVPILTGFDLEYVGGDRHLASMEVGWLPDRPGRFQLSLRDNDGDEVLRGWARYLRYEQVLRRLREETSTSTESDVLNLRSVTRSGCRGGCQVEIPGLDKTRYDFYLSGFRFAFHGDDRHLSNVRIWPFGEVAGATSVWTDFRDDDEDRVYDVTLSYVLLPRSHSIGGVLYGGHVISNDGSGTVRFPGRNQSGRALAGFGVGFAGGDEHLLRIGARVHRNGGEVTLRDDDAREDLIPYLAEQRLPVE